jgi:hypothetical protein
LSLTTSSTINSVILLMMNSRRLIASSRLYKLRAR